ncbi:competence type IV pilus major pilin ComGC [Vaginisenegalia massiliensis]|uniref:competence type IV pilus major pilin ComGC n=1 Tax=Vaginisenegalia massiliensis TaxID=2058294 RepID=UPI001F14F9CC|nr:competence type IV pilus major pilin ComGC [Vaginisenegalia massiliensis]
MSVLRDFLRQRSKQLKGFTLIELLVVLLIISILMAIIIPNIAGQKNKIETQSKVNIAEIIETQVHTYQLVENDNQVSLSELADQGYITNKQVEEAGRLLKLNPDTTITLPISIPN